MNDHPSDRAYPWFHLYADSWLADLSGMGTLERGAYVTLALNAWMRRGRLPYETAKLAKIAGCSARVIDSLVRDHPHLFQFEDDTLRLVRLDAELSRTQAISQTRAHAGRRSGAARREMRLVAGAAND